MEAKIDSLTHANEGLMIQNDILERDVCDHDELLAEARDEAEANMHDRDLLLCVGVVRIMEKLIEHAEFTGAVIRIRYTVFVVGEESECSRLKAKVDSGSYDPNVSNSRSSHSTSLNDARLAFTTMDHVSHVGLGNLDMEGMHQLCVL